MTILDDENGAPLEHLGKKLEELVLGGTTPPDQGILARPTDELRDYFAKAVTKAETEHFRKEEESLGILATIVKRFQEADLPAALNTAPFATDRAAWLTLGKLNFRVSFKDETTFFHDSKGEDYKLPEMLDIGGMHEENRKELIKTMTQVVARLHVASRIGARHNVAAKATTP